MGTQTTNKQEAKRKGQQCKGLQDDGDAAVACGQGRTSNEVIFRQKSKRREKMSHEKPVRGKKMPCAERIERSLLKVFQNHEATSDLRKMGS